MKISELKEMEVGEILNALELPESFIEDFKKWCEEEKARTIAIDGVSAWGSSE